MKPNGKKIKRNGQFRDVTLLSIVANWASISFILGAQPDFYSLWASGRPLICIPVIIKLSYFIHFRFHDIGRTSGSESVGVGLEVKI